MTSHDPIAAALAEDLGSGDITSETFIPATLDARARVVAKQRATVAGTAAAAETFRRVDPSLSINLITPDSTDVQPGDTLLEIAGRARSILSAERVALNFLQRLSGIATLTRRFADAVAGSGATLLDTRKTTPGLRALEKAAVRSGGGANHRFGLYDMVMVKDNHLAATRDWHDLATRIAGLRARRPTLRIEVEADSLEQLERLLPIPGIDVILLDNMSPDQLRAAAALAGPKPRRPQLEASGGIHLGNAAEIARTGVDFLSVGALTHSAPAVDLSLEFI